MSEVVHVDDSNFETEVVESKLPVLVDFSATWCQPCQRQMPLLEKFAAENGGRVKVVKVDIDDSPMITSKLKIKGVPTLMLFQEGSSVASKVGLTSLAEMNNLVLSKVSG